MTSTIHRIELPLPFRLGRVNAYLVETFAGFVLVDTGCPRSRGALEWALVDAHCGSNDLSLVVLTHGDFDHIGNAAMLRNEYSAKLAMHGGDALIASTGDMFSSRKTRPNPLVRVFAPRLMGFGKRCRFKPKILLEDGQSLTEWGLDATVLSLPGHSAGSIGILTSEGDLICGDLLENVKKPTVGSIVDDVEQARASVARLRGLDIRNVYPGHGARFKFSALPEDAV